VEARGKHLLIWFGDGHVLHTHMRMNGSWHLARPGERWRAPHGSARAVIETPALVAVCFRAPVVELLTHREVDRHPALSALGPDLCLPDPDLDDISARLERSDPQRPIAEVLLDQRVASGIGNVYKAEVLHACGVHPSTALGSLDASARRELYATAARLLRGNLRSAHRRTVPEGLAVYGRRGLPCRRCGATIREDRGPDARVTAWCPGCQEGPAARADASAAWDTRT
jgi:endonuclease-8